MSNLSKHRSSATMSNLLVIIWMSVFRFFLTFLHFAYTGFEYLDIGWALLKRKLSNFRKINSVSDTVLVVSNLVKKLEKSPSHFLIVLGDDGILEEDFCNLVIWCLTANISHVSFYDYTGYLKENGKTYYKHLIDKRKIDPRLIIYNLDEERVKNGISPKIHLNILSMEDGKPLFVKLAKILSTKVVLKELKTTEIKEKLISEELLKLTGIPEPELCLISGTICGTFGYVPWDLRVTEFVQLKSLKGIQVSEFEWILRKYSSCTQRFGK